MAYPLNRTSESFLIAFALSTVVLGGLVVTRIAWFDTLWFLTEKPPWFTVTKGHNRLIDLELRRAKQLHLMTRQVTGVLVGSSTVYRGLDPDLLAEPFYNAGLSSFVARELPVIADLIAARPEIQDVYIGLDYYMFTPNKFDWLLNDNAGTWKGRVEAYASAFLSAKVLSYSTNRWVNEYNDVGAWWTYMGFRTKLPRPADQTLDFDADQRANLKAFDPSSIIYLTAALERLNDRHVVVFIQPTSDQQRLVLGDLGLMPYWEQWRSAIANASRKVRFVDLSSGVVPTDDFDPSKGSSASWTDNLHYTPANGPAIFARLGLELRR